MMFSGDVFLTTIPNPTRPPGSGTVDGRATFMIVIVGWTSLKDTVSLSVSSASLPSSSSTEARTKSVCDSPALPESTWSKEQL